MVRIVSSIFEVNKQSKRRFDSPSTIILPWTPRDGSTCDIQAPQPCLFLATKFEWSIRWRRQLEGKRKRLVVGFLEDSPNISSKKEIFRCLIKMFFKSNQGAIMLMSRVWFFFSGVKRAQNGHTWNEKGFHLALRLSDQLPEHAYISKQLWEQRNYHLPIRMRSYVALPIPRDKLCYRAARTRSFVLPI